MDVGSVNSPSASAARQAAEAPQPERRQPKPEEKPETT
ncbi:MAG: hypothetical protein QG584_547, partial [Pseudomonadota bacterium]|nr:hypothetical protein [Pseudomonadota bacterium]